MSILLLSIPFGPTRKDEDHSKMVLRFIYTFHHFGHQSLLLRCLLEEMPLNAQI
jgi:hypothetical protein